MALTRFPGLIDIHVHLREPAATHKEDMRTGTRAAVKGGFTFVIDMPNNPLPTISEKRIKQKITLADKKAVCDVGFHFGSMGDNIGQFQGAYKNKRIFGMKLFLNPTTGDMKVEDLKLLCEIFKNWKTEKPILVHAEGNCLAMAIGLAQLFDRRLHVCHIAREEEIELVRLAKKKGLKISAGTCPHYLFLTSDYEKKMGQFTLMKPPLGSKKDLEALWEGLLRGTIDLVESDHAPHAKEEKLSNNPSFGVPGLETGLGLMLKAVKEGRIKLNHIKQWYFNKPKKIFNIPEQKNTYIEFDPEAAYKVSGRDLETKCGWSLFTGWELYGKVQKVVIRSKPVLVDGEFKILDKLE